MKIDPILRKKIRTLESRAASERVQKKVVGAVMRKGDLVLVVCRASDDFMGGLVELPSGTVDDGESLFDALEREVREETSLQIHEITGVLPTFDYLSGSGKRTRQFNFLVRKFEGEVQLDPKEHEWFKWLSPSSDEWSELHISPQTRSVILDAMGHS